MTWSTRWINPSPKLIKSAISGNQICFLWRIWIFRFQILLYFHRPILGKKTNLRRSITKVKSIMYHWATTWDYLLLTVWIRGLLNNAFLIIDKQTHKLKFIYKCSKRHDFHGEKKKYPLISDSLVLPFRSCMICVEFIGSKLRLLITTVLGVT